MNLNISKKEQIEKISIHVSDSILDALKKMDLIQRKLLLVVGSNEGFVGVLSIGDIQRAIIRNISLELPIENIIRTEIKVASVRDDINDIKSFIRSHRSEFMPVIDENNQVRDVIFWEELFEKKNERVQTNLNLPVIIMAGGKGNRLKPLTNILPKPLIPIGEQTILEDIMDRFVASGCNDFYLSINYKADFIKQYLNNLEKPHYRISYFQESKPLGTAGSLHLLKNKIKTTFFVSNCDIIIDEDYAEILNYHKENQNEITVVAAIKNYPIPYGTLETGDNGILKSIQEKPEFTFKINTGMYILEPHLLNEIPNNEFFHITSLMEKLCKESRKVGVFPINEGSWTDIGNWDEYLKYIKKN